MDPKWVDEIEHMCRRHDVAFFFKQWGGRNKKATGRLLHGRTYDEMPRIAARSKEGRLILLGCHRLPKLSC